MNNSHARFKASILTFRNPKRICATDALVEAELELCRKERGATNGNGVSQSDRILCDCPETRMQDGSRLALHRVTDCEYSKARSLLVEEAVALADKAFGNEGKSSWRNSNNWMRHFKRGCGE